MKIRAIHERKSVSQITEDLYKQYLKKAKK